MKKIIVVMVVIAVLIVSVLAYGYTQEMFNIIKSMPFELGMSVRRVKNKFEKYQLSSITERQDSAGEITLLTYQNKLDVRTKETLTFYFQNDVLYGFDYRNWQVK